MKRTALAAVLLLGATSIGVPLGGSARADGFTCHGEPATIVGGRGGDVLVGTPGRDVIVGRAGFDEIRGRGGDDLICGGPGRDILQGGPGDDLLHVGPADGSFADLVHYRSATRGVHADLRSGIVTGQGRDQVLGEQIELRGSRHDDVLIGGPATVALVGLEGDDRITGTDGDDRLSGDHFRPTMMSGDDVIHGRGGDDTIYPGRGDDVAHGGSGNDMIGSGLDHPSGSDLLNGGRGRDWISDIVGPDDRDEYRGGGGGWDSLMIRTHFERDGEVTHPNGRMRLDGAWTTFGDRHAEGRVSNVNRVILPVGRWRLVGTDRAEALWATRDSDPLGRGVTILGRGGNDNIVGTEHDDVLLGGGGHDRACGNGGSDEIEAEEQAVSSGDLCEPGVS